MIPSQTMSVLRLALTWICVRSDFGINESNKTQEVLNTFWKFVSPYLKKKQTKNPKKLDKQDFNRSVSKSNLGILDLPLSVCT